MVEVSGEQRTERRAHTGKSASRREAGAAAPSASAHRRFALFLLSARGRKMTLPSWIAPYFLEVESKLTESGYTQRQRARAAVRANKKVSGD